MKWTLVTIIVLATTFGEVMQATLAWYREHLPAKSA